MDKVSKKIFSLFTRYIFIFLAGLGNLYIFNIILKPLNYDLLYFVLSIFGRTAIIGEYILARGTLIELIPACLASSAFYLLFILLMSIQEIKPLKRVALVLSAFLTLFILNFLRIIILIIFIGSPSFEALHWTLWHIISTLFVVGIWFAIIKLEKIKSRPFYSDLKFLYGSIKNSKKSKGKR